MNAESLLIRIAEALAKEKLEAVMIGNAAAAIQGAPVTTVDIDFLFRKTPRNIQKLKGVAKLLGAQIFRPYYPQSGLYRLVNEDIGLQLDFLTQAHGINSFAGLRSRAQEFSIGEYQLRIAALSDIIKSKRAAKRKRDEAVLEVLEKTAKLLERAKKGK